MSDQKPESKHAVAKCFTVRNGDGGVARRTERGGNAVATVNRVPRIRRTVTGPGSRLSGLPNGSKTESTTGPGVRDRFPGFDCSPSCRRKNEPQTARGWRKSFALRDRRTCDEPRRHAAHSRPAWFLLWKFYLKNYIEMKFGVLNKIISFSNNLPPSSNRLNLFPLYPQRNSPLLPTHSLVYKLFLLMFSNPIPSHSLLKLNTFLHSGNSNFTDIPGNGKW